MPRVVKPSFNAGEFSPRAYGRIDIEKYPNGCKTMRNFLSMPLGGSTRRPGLEYIAETKTSTKLSRLIPFTFSTTQAYMIESGDLYMRFFKDGGQVQTVDANTSLLIHGDGDNASTSFTDAGNTGHTITANGNAQVSTSQSKFGGAALLIPSGIGDYLSVPDHADWNFGAAEFTIDCWIRFHNTDNHCHTIYSQLDSTASDYIILKYDFASQAFIFTVMNADVNISRKVASATLTEDIWYHIAVIRGWGGVTDDWAITVDGSAVGTWTAAGTMPDHDQQIRIGDSSATFDHDMGDSGHYGVTFNNNAVLNTAATKWYKGAADFDGAGDYLSLVSSVAWDLVTQTNFTLDLWVRHTDHAGTEAYVNQYEDGTNFWTFHHAHGTGLRFRVNSGGSNIVILDGGEITDSSWHHAAVCKVGDDYGLYLDGAQVAHVNDNSTDTFTGSLYIGNLDGAGSTWDFDGQMQEVRITHTNDFSATPVGGLTDTITVPTGPHTMAETGTKLLLKLSPHNFFGWIDEIRVSKGVARWTAAFTPPTSEYPAGDGSGTAYEIVTTYTESELANLRWVQSADILYIVSPDRQPKKLSRTAHTSWTLTDFTYDSDNWPAFLDLNKTATTLDAGALTGSSVALVASVAFFDDNHVGAYFAMHSGYVKITGVTDTTNAVCDVIDDLTAHTATANWYESAWSDYQGWPTSITFYEDRLCFSGTANNPDRMELSQTGQYENFKRAELDAADSAAASDGMSIILGSRQVNAVKWLASTRKLLAGTTGAEWWLDGKDSSSSLDATEIPRARNDSDYGSASVAPVFIGNSVFFLQRLGKIVRAFAYDWETDQYAGRNMSVLAEHLTNFYNISEMTWQQTPHQVIWAVRSDGVLLGLTYMREHQVEGWHRHEAGGTDAAFESIATIEGQNEDELWCIVKRTINSATKRYVERMGPLVQIDTGQGGSSDWTLNDAFFVDSGLTYRGTAATSISGLSHLEGESVVALADGAVVSSLTVTSGAITLSSAASVVHVGLNYQSDLEPLWPVVKDNSGIALGVAQRTTQLNLMLYRSSGGKYGPDSSNLVAINYSDGNWTESADYYTGTTDELSNDGGFEGSPTPFLRQDEPLPMTVLAMIMQIEV